MFVWGLYMDFGENLKFFVIRGVFRYFKLVYFVFMYFIFCFGY